MNKFLITMLEDERVTYENVREYFTNNHGITSYSKDEECISLVLKLVDRHLQEIEKATEQVNAPEKQKFSSSPLG